MGAVAAVAGRRKRGFRLEKSFEPPARGRYTGNQNADGLGQA
jgi:hypothetical protein